MNDTNSPKDLPGVLARMREIEDSLRKTDNDPKNLEPDTQAELIDELMMLDMGMQPLRRAISKRKSLDVGDQPPAKSS